MLKIRKLGSLVREAWLLVGISILLLCFLEAVLGLAFLFKDRLSASDASGAEPRIAADAYADAPWVKDYYEEFDRSYAVQWRPYVYWRRKPFHGEYINVDADGIRMTTPAPPQESHPPVRVFMFGGSTLWGTGARDAFTIPSILTRELSNRGLPAEVTNFGESGYVSTQEVIALLRRLQTGPPPDVVIFYDGVNDVYSAYQQRVAGLPQNEFNRVDEFNLSQPGGLKRRAFMDLRDVAARLSTVRLTKGLLGLTGTSREPGGYDNPLHVEGPAPDDEALASDVLATYAGNVEIVKALGEHYRFQSLFYWQPTVFDKAHLTEYERMQRAELQGIAPLVRATDEAVRRSGLAERPGIFFHDLSRAFADVREPVYIDWCHLGEAGNRTIAKAIAGDVLRLLAPGE